MPGAPATSDIPPTVDTPADADTPAKKPRKIGWIVAVSVLGVALIALGTLFALTYSGLEDAKKTIREQGDRIDEQNDQLDEQKKLIDEKQTFGESMGGLLDKTTAFEGLPLGGLVDWSRYQEIADAAYDGRWDAAAVRDATAQAVAASGELDALVAGARKQAASNSSGTVFEKVIDSLGKGFVTTSLDDASGLCGGPVLGCVLGRDPYTVHIDKASAKRPYTTSFIEKGIAYHEFAHVLQFANPAATAQPLLAFGGDHEKMADCFALTYVKGWTLKHTVRVGNWIYTVTTGYGYTCNAKEKRIIRDWYESLAVVPRAISQ